jgi:hypothetical protein
MAESSWDQYFRREEEEEVTEVPVTEFPAEEETTAQTSFPSSDALPPLPPPGEAEDFPMERNETIPPTMAPSQASPIHTLREEFNPRWIIWFCLILFGIWLVWKCCLKRYFLRRRRDIETQNAMRVLGDMQLVPSDDFDDEERHQHQQSAQDVDDNELI